MKSSVKVTANNEGKVFVANEKIGKDGNVYGYIRVAQTIVDLSGAFARTKVISALKPISHADYEKAKDFLVAGTEMSGKIVRLESLTQEQGYQPKMGGDSGVACTVNGQPIFQTTKLDSTGLESDVLIAHDNGAEISAAIAEQAQAETLN